MNGGEHMTNTYGTTPTFSTREMHSLIQEKKRLLNEFSQKGDIPVYIGVFGHRNFRNGADEQLKTAVKKAIIDIASDYPNTRFVVLTALAMGADQIAAEAVCEFIEANKNNPDSAMRSIASRLAFEAVLPVKAEAYFNRASYEDIRNATVRVGGYAPRIKEDFPAENGSKQKAWELLNSKHCKFVYELPYLTYPDGHHITGADFLPGANKNYARYQFRECSRYIAEHSSTMIAMWDGKAIREDEKAGTGVLVSDVLHGKYRAGSDSDITIPDTRPIYHIFTPTDDVAHSYDFGLRKLYPEPLLETGTSWFTIDAYNHHYEGGGVAYPTEKKQNDILDFLFSYGAEATDAEISEARKRFLKTYSDDNVVNRFVCPEIIHSCKKDKIPEELLQASRKKTKGSSGKRELRFNEKIDSVQYQTRADVFFDQLKSIDEYNKALLTTVVEANAYDDLPLSVPNALSRDFCKKRYNICNALAAECKKRREKGIIAILVLAAFAYLLLNAFSDWVASPIFLAAYIVMLAAAYLCLKKTESRQDHRNYVDSRTLAEGLRVQTYWYTCGISEDGELARVEEYYLRRQKGKIEWIRTALRNWNFEALMLCGDSVRIPNYQQLSDTFAEWIGKQDPNNNWAIVKNGSQLEYFSGKRIKTKNEEEKNNHAAFVLTSLSAVLAIVLAALIIGGYFILKAQGHEVPTIGEMLWDFSALTESFPVLGFVYSLVCFAAGALPVIAMVIREESRLMGFDKDTERYDWYYNLFKRTVVQKQLIDENTKMGENEKIAHTLRLLLNIGKEALIENADWAITESDRAPSLPDN